MAVFKKMRSAAALLIVMAMLALSIPAFAVSAMDYNEHDVAKLLAFYEYTSNLNISNGVVLNGTDFDTGDPSTWKGCTWNSDGRLTAVNFSNSGVVGVLDLEDCSALTYVSCYWCKLTGVNITGCPLITDLEVDHNSIPSIDISGCPELSILWLGKNQLTELDVSNNPLLTKLSCSENQLTELDVTNCPLLTYLDVGTNNLTELDVTNCTELWEFTCKANKLTELDLSNCTKLERFRSLGNMFKTLDISVLNGGEEFIIKAAGSGYVGTKCNINSTGVHTVANAVSADGAAYYGWYENGEQLAATADYACEFGSGARKVTARFDGYAHKLSVNYVFEDGSEAAPEYVSELAEDESYSVVSPAVEGYYTDTLKVEGVMGDDDISFEVIYHPIPTDLLMGDVDDNGVVNSLDALTLLRYCLGVYAPTNHLLWTGDVDGSGSINSVDALVIMRMALGLA